MHITWNDPAERRFKEGDFYIGAHPTEGYDIGVAPDTAALTVAKARSGKGAGVMIPNLLRWPDSALVIDPKGEAAEATAEEREKRFGIPSYVLDPFGYCDVPDRLRARFNPLDEIEIGRTGAREDILTLADGIIMRTDPRSEHWEGGGAGYLAGLIAHVVEHAPHNRRNMQEVANLINLDDEAKNHLWTEMGKSDGVGKLARDAGRRMLATKEAQYFESVVRGHTGWLSSDDIAPTLIDSTFQLSDLRTKGCTVYLVLPPDMIDAHPHFLRLFVMAAIRAMGRERNGRRCLFLLDEFYALGHIAKTDKAAGLLPGFGVHLWPFLQNIGQLSIYGKEAAEAFIENADVLQFFGLGPGPSADYVSQKLGAVDLSEMEGPPEHSYDSLDFTRDFLTNRDEDTPILNMRFARRERARQKEMNEYQHQMRKHGSTRVTPSEVVDLIAKDGTPLARGQIALIKGKPYLLGLRGWFEKTFSRREDVQLPGNNISPQNYTHNTKPQWIEQVFALVSIPSWIGMVAAAQTFIGDGTFLERWSYLSMVVMPFVVWNIRKIHRFLMTSTAERLGMSVAQGLWRFLLAYIVIPIVFIVGLLLFAPR